MKTCYSTCRALWLPARTAIAVIRGRKIGSNRKGEVDYRCCLISSNLLLIDVKIVNLQIAFTFLLHNSCSVFVRCQTM